jgi:hypothetical protein
VDRAREAARDKIDACAEELKKNKTFEQQPVGKLKVKETKFFKSTDKIDELGPGQAVLGTQARNLKPEETSGPFSDGNGCYILKLQNS